MTQPADHPADVLLITATTGQHENQTAFYAQVWGNSIFGNDWICGDNPGSYYCDVQKIRRDVDNWAINGNKIDYCLAQ